MIDKPLIYGPVGVVFLLLGSVVSGGVGSGMTVWGLVCVTVAIIGGIKKLFSHKQPGEEEFDQFLKAVNQPKSSQLIKMAQPFFVEFLEGYKSIKLRFTGDTKIERYARLVEMVIGGNPESPRSISKQMANGASTLRELGVQLFRFLAAQDGTDIGFQESEKIEAIAEKVIPAHY